MKTANLQFGCANRNCIFIGVNRNSNKMAGTHTQHKQQLLFLFDVCCACSGVVSVEFVPDELSWAWVDSS